MLNSQFWMVITSGQARKARKVQEENSGAFKGLQNVLLFKLRAGHVGICYIIDHVLCMVKFGFGHQPRGKVGSVLATVSVTAFWGCVLGYWQGPSLNGSLFRSVRWAQRTVTSWFLSSLPPSFLPFFQQIFIDYLLCGRSQREGSSWSLQS